jgi:hypothetical protein
LGIFWKKRIAEMDEQTFFLVFVFFLPTSLVLRASWSVGPIHAALDGVLAPAEQQAQSETLTV